MPFHMPATSDNKLSNEFVVMPLGMPKREQSSLQIHKLLYLKKYEKRQRCLKSSPLNSIKTGTTAPVYGPTFGLIQDGGN